MEWYLPDRKVRELLMSMRQIADAVHGASEQFAVEQRSLEAIIRDLMA